MLLGTLIGVLPGIGPVATIAMLLPTTYALQPVSALIMLAGIYYGAQYGGSTTAILVNMPGESSSVVTCLDGYQMARKGQAGAALAIAALGSFFAGTVGTLILAALAGPLAELALKFGPAEYFSLMVLGLIGAVVLAHGSLLKAIAMIVLGLLLGIVGTDVNSGVARFGFGVPELTDGIGFVGVAMGLFGFAEIIANLEHKGERLVFTDKVGKLACPQGAVQGGVARGAARHRARLGPRRPARRRRAARVLRLLHGREEGHAQSEDPFGKGAIHGVAGPESANNAGAQTSFIPLLTLGIPPNAVMALMVGAMTIHNIQPGPQVMTSNPSLFWGLIASMWIGNLMLVVLNLPLIGIWIKLLKVPYRLLYPAILLFCCIGVYTINNNSFDVMHDRGVRPARVSSSSSSVRAGAAAARLRARPDDGGEPAPRAAAVARRPDGVLHPPAVADAAADGRGAGRHHRAAAHPQEARRGVPGSRLRRDQPARCAYATSDDSARASSAPTATGRIATAPNRHELRLDHPLPSAASRSSRATSSRRRSRWRRRRHRDAAARRQRGRRGARGRGHAHDRRAVQQRPRRGHLRDRLGRHASCSA